MFDPHTILHLPSAVINAIVKVISWLFGKSQPNVNQGAALPKETLRLALKQDGACWWAAAKRGDEPLMQISGSMFITNIATVPIRIPQIELRYGFWRRKRFSGMVMVSRGVRDNMHGMYDIPPGETRDASVHFFLPAFVKNPLRPFTAHSIAFIDQFGNRHVLKHVRFRSIAADSRPEPKEPEEFPYQITDPIEKTVVSVLKAEIARYKICGRTVGGLGSVHIVYQGRQFTSFGGDSWSPNSPLNQLIVSDPEVASLRSDNLKALIEFYKRLGTDDERKRFVDVLLDRLDEKAGYLAISYFIVTVLWNVGAFSYALQKAKYSLPAGENRVFGLSNVLMLLNGLLRYRHSDFTDEMLDDIERLTHGLNEHPFLIPEKLAAIRASRLSKLKGHLTR